MTRVFFVRHAKPDMTVKDDRNRPLTESGIASTSFVSDVLATYYNALSNYNVYR